jgi:hypothetical protein
MVVTRPGRGAAAADQILVAVPVELKSLVQPITALIAAVEKQRHAVSGSAGVDYAAIERELAEHAAAIERGSHEAVLARMEVDAKRVVIRGETYARVGYGKGIYYTMTGPVRLKRALYRKLGTRNARVVDAISVRTGAVGDGWLPWTAQAMAQLLQQGTSREAQQTARQMGRLPYSRASFERVPHEVAAQYLPHQVDIEQALIEELEIPKQTRSISQALDRVALPMAEPRKRAPGRPRKDAPKRPVSRAWRMAYCGTLTLHDAHGQSLHTIRYGCMPKADAAALAQRMATDAQRLLTSRPRLSLTMLADGAPEMWKLLGAAHLPGHEPYQIVDFWHVVEKLHPAAAAIHGADDAHGVIARWKRMLRERPQGAAAILRELELSGCEHKLIAGEQPVHEAITYLRNNGSRMDYRDARRRGLPIGSGNVEATCKTLVGVRMKRCGARWKERTGEHVLQLRALALSDRLDSALSKLFATRRTAVTKAA